MAKWILVVETNCTDTAREAEFNQWYDNVHVAGVLKVPGITKATRYEYDDPPAGRGKFLAVYEIETDSIADTLKALDENRAAEMAAGQFSELISLVSRGVYRQISSLSR